MVISDISVTYRELHKGPPENISLRPSGNVPMASIMKRPLVVIDIPMDNVVSMPQMSQVLRVRAIVMLTAGMSTGAARELNVNFSTISRLQHHFRPPTGLTYAERVCGMVCWRAVC
jgi:hypothetical protein